MAEIGRQWPWPRDLHSGWSRRCETPGRPRSASTSSLPSHRPRPKRTPRSPLRWAPTWFSRATKSLVETPQGDQLIRVEALSELTAGGARTGIASIPLDADATFRRLPAYPDGFARELLGVAGRPRNCDRTRREAQVFGPARTLPTVSYYQAGARSGRVPSRRHLPRPHRDRGPVDAVRTHRRSGWSRHAPDIVDRPERPARARGGDPRFDRREPVARTGHRSGISRGGARHDGGRRPSRALVVWRRSGIVTLVLATAGVIALVIVASWSCASVGFTPALPLPCLR